MSRFSPSVLPTAGASFTQHLAAAFDEFEGARRRRRSDEMAVEDRATAAGDRQRRIGIEEEDRKRRADLEAGDAEFAALLAGDGRPGATPAPTRPPVNDRSWSAGIAMPPRYPAPVPAASGAAPGPDFSDSDFASQLRGTPTRQPMPDLAQELRAAPAVTQAPPPRPIAPPASMGAGLPSSHAPAAGNIPGAFDPATGTFGRPPRVTITPDMARRSPAARAELQRRTVEDEQLYQGDHRALLADALRPPPNPPTPPAPRTQVTDKGIMQYDPTTGTWKPTGMKAPTPAARSAGSTMQQVPTERDKAMFLRDRVKELTAPPRYQGDPPALSPEAAVAQARGEWDLIVRGGSAATAPPAQSPRSETPLEAAARALREPPSGASPFARPGSALPALTDAQKQRAAADPEYKAFLAAKGYQL